MSNYMQSKVSMYNLLRCNVPFPDSRLIEESEQVSTLPSETIPGQAFSAKECVQRALRNQVVPTNPHISYDAEDDDEVDATSRISFDEFDAADRIQEILSRVHKSKAAPEPPPTTENVKPETNSQDKE